MIGADLMSATHKPCFEVKNNNTVLFSGIATVWYGNFCQFAPIGDAALYHPRNSTANLWLTVLTDCVILNQPMRQLADKIEFLCTRFNPEDRMQR